MYMSIIKCVIYFHNYTVYSPCFIPVCYKTLEYLSVLKPYLIFNVKIRRSDKTASVQLYNYTKVGTFVYFRQLPMCSQEFQ